MKKVILWAFGGLAGLVVLIAMVAVGGLVLLLMIPGQRPDPQMVAPSSATPAAADAAVGYVLEPVGHTLTVISRQDVVIVGTEGPTLAIVTCGSSSAHGPTGQTR